MSDALLSRIAVALEKLADRAGSAYSEPQPDAKPAGTRGRPPGSTNKPKPVEAAPSTAPAAEPETTDAEAIPDVSEVSAAVTATIKAGFRTEVLETLAKYKAKNASGVPAGDRAAFLAELGALTDAAG